MASLSPEAAAVYVMRIMSSSKRQSVLQDEVKGSSRSSLHYLFHMDTSLQLTTFISTMLLFYVHRNMSVDVRLCSYQVILTRRVGGSAGVDGVEENERHSKSA